MAKVKNQHGTEIDFEAAVNLMDEELCYDLHEELAPCTEQDFFDRYCERHMEKFGEEFEPNKKNPVW